MLTVVRICPTLFLIWQKSGCGIRSFCLPKRKPGYGCLDTSLTFYVSEVLLANRFSTYHYQQETVQIFTHMKLPNLTLLTFKLF